MAFKEKVKELSRELKIELPELHGARINLLVLAVLGICSVRSINLVKVSHAMVSKAKPSSNYRRLQRFIAEICWSDTRLSFLILKISQLRPPYVILIDRTNWKFGKVNINFLVFTILGDGYSIPIKWVLLPKQGNSAQFERIDLLKEVVAVLGQGNIRYVIGDREFIGEHWIKYLINNNIGFILRVKEGMLAMQKGKVKKLETWCRNNKRSSPTLKGKFIIGENEVYVSGFKFRNDKKKLENLILISSDGCDDVCDMYAMRWYIENMFKDMKTNGFQLEDTHVTNPKRLETLFGLMALAYTWMIRVGEWVKQNNPRLFKKKRDGKRRKSVFRAGVDNYMRSFIIRDYRKFWLYFRFLSCT